MNKLTYTTTIHGTNNAKPLLSLEEESKFKLYEF